LTPIRGECYNFLAAFAAGREHTGFFIACRTFLRKQVMRMSDFEILSIFLCIAHHAKGALGTLVKSKICHR